jgi:hypothetical protein
MLIGNSAYHGVTVPVLTVCVDIRPWYAPATCVQILSLGA